MAPSAETYRDMLVAARRVARSDDEARDLVQGVLEIALGYGVQDWASPERRAWLRGVLRRHAALVVRGEQRRRRREALAEAPSEAGASAWVWRPRFLASLPRSLRVVAALASADLCAAEIRWLLELTETALRQRLSALRRAVRSQAEAPTLPTPRPPAAFGSQRAQVLAQLRRRGGRVVATHDPDGHVIFLKIDPHEAAPDGNA